MGLRVLSANDREFAVRFGLHLHFSKSIRWGFLLSFSCRTFCGRMAKGLEPERPSTGVLPSFPSALVADRVGLAEVVESAGEPNEWGAPQTVGFKSKGRPVLI
jgi:hypothetical protein